MKFYLYLIGIIILIALGLGLGYLIFHQTVSEPKIDSLVIYNKLQSQGFLVTQNYVLEQKVTIDNTSGQLWKDFFWGQKIDASAVLKVNLGVDLQKLKKENIAVNDKIEINLPAIEIQSVEIAGDISLQNQQGVLKRLLNNDDGYNQALSQLKEQAKLAAQNPDIIRQSRESTQKEVERLIRLITEEKEVEISF